MVFPIDLNESTRNIAQHLLGISDTYPRVDCHTHVQGDLFNFNQETATKNLIGSQSIGLNQYPYNVIQESIKTGRLVRRTMIDAVPSYSWFAQLALGGGLDFDKVIKMERKDMGRAILSALTAFRFSERAEWIRHMYNLYHGVKSRGDDFDPLDPANFDIVYDAVSAQRNDSLFADNILKEDKIVALVTSLENASHVPLKLEHGKESEMLKSIDLSIGLHPEIYYMLDVHYIVCPEKATDLGPYFLGCKYQTENYLLNIENRLGSVINNAHDLSKTIKDWIHGIIRSPLNPYSRVLYANTFQPIDRRLNVSIEDSEINSIIKNHKSCMDSSQLMAVSSYATQSILEALNEIGAEIKKENGLGVCFQIAIGVDYFIDPEREITAFKAYQPRIPKDEEPVWKKYHNIIFEYLVADEKLLEDFMDAAKQVPNVIVSSWWQGFGSRSIAHIVSTMAWESSLDKFAGGISDGRYVEMLSAKGESVRNGVAAGLAQCVSQGRLPLKIAENYMKDLLYTNPARIHNIPLS